MGYTSAGWMDLFPSTGRYIKGYSTPTSQVSKYIACAHNLDPSLFAFALKDAFDERYRARETEDEVDQHLVARGLWLPTAHCTQSSSTEDTSD